MNEVILLIVETSGADAFARTRKVYIHFGYMEEPRIRDRWSPEDDKIIHSKPL